MTFPGIEHDPQAPQVNPDMLAVEERRREREAEYGVWVAVQDIPWGTVLAAIPGMPVPASTVERLKWDELGLVAKRDSKAGREVLERTGTATTEERQRWAAQAAAEKKAAAEKPAAEKAEAEKPAEKAADKTARTTTTTTEGAR
ncbi:hypothetical protein [Micromonospora sp. WMMD1219]|uniref:hypothetical protein n=1 Tax=Micromonospora sp. WMMD1219 TaxID=3404115 RepID=UPI003BF58113